ncbi:MAG: hypothetical protein Q8P73_01475 [bacterium]|nr:hypothetical protein [bacterium]MDZ4344444.1 hypothetical protein [Candidatus Binatia bacterium]
MWLTIIILAAGSLAAAGVLFKQERVIVWLACAGVLAEGQWMLLSLIKRTLAPGINEEWFFLAGAIVLTLVWGAGWRKFKLPVFGVNWWMKEGVVLLLILITGAGAWLVWSVNGWDDGQWVTHGFLNGDTTTFTALVQRSFDEPGLVSANPFAAGENLEYPTVLHGAVADFLLSIKAEGKLLAYLKWFTYGQIALTIPCFFLLLDIFNPEPAEKWQRWYSLVSRRAVLLLQGGVVLYVMALSWDGFVYPQSHFFLTGLYILTASLLLSAERQSGRAQFLMVATGSVTALLLLLSNAVMGTAAAGLVIIFYLTRAMDKKRSVPERATWLIATLIWPLVFITATPGNGSFGVPGFSYTAAGDMIRLAPILFLLFAVVLERISRNTLMSSWVMGLSSIALITFVFSTRDIVVANSARFFYQAILVVFPLLIYSVIRIWYWLKRELIFSTRSVVETVSGWAGVTVLGVLILMPAAASIVSAHDNLQRKDQQIISRGQVQASAWLKSHTATEVVWLAQPNEPWIIPAMTGRSMLRTDFWLSPEDSTFSSVKAALAGDSRARKEILEKVDYVWLNREEANRWGGTTGEKVFDDGDVIIYKTR